ncbi:unnamed protein product [Coregonus sp. 'balchen']|nr:unnamed protein product [Coregonus sp. 'balchen']
MLFYTLCYTRVHVCVCVHVCVSQNPALVEYPISLQLELNSAPKTTIKTSGATVAVTAIVTVMVLPPGTAPVQLSSMTMEAKFNAKVSMKGKRLAVHADLRSKGLREMIERKIQADAENTI